MKKVLIFFLKVYKKGISPYLPNACRFTPTCSEYAMEAISKHGAIKGTMLASYRLLRCNPFCRGGYDPVPDKFTFKRQDYAHEYVQGNPEENYIGENSEI